MLLRHPKYYKELRKRNKSDQAISLRAHDGERERAPGPGLKQQAPSFKLQALKDTSDKLQAPSYKPQASSRKLQAPGSRSLEKVSRTFDQGPLPR